MQMSSVQNTYTFAKEIITNWISQELTSSMMSSLNCAYHREAGVKLLRILQSSSFLILNQASFANNIALKVVNEKVTCPSSCLQLWTNFNQCPSYSRNITSPQVQGVTTAEANFEERSKHFWFVPFHVEAKYICQAVDGLTLFSTCYFVLAEWLLHGAES